MRWGLMIAALFLALPAQAQSDPDFDEKTRVKNLVEWLAFDPDLFFGSPNYFNAIRIRSSFESWPIYSIAIVDGCAVKGAPRPACADQRLARMVRAPIGARGNNLVAAIRKTGARDEVQISVALDKAGLEWLEADLVACPGAMAVVGKASAVPWGPYNDRNTVFRMASHAEMIEVLFSVSDGDMIWRGAVFDGTPSAWAKDLATVLEPCWKPARAPAPWRRVREAE